MNQAIRTSSWARAKLSRQVVATRASTAGIQVSATAVFAATIFLSATLLFLLEPMIAKMMLPMLGGTPAVWTTCVVFFQAWMLLGYFYAHALSTRFNVRTQAVVHAVIVVASVVCLPFDASKVWPLVSGLPPAVSVFAVLALTVGLPFFSLSANAPLLQSWFLHARGESKRDPYFLYAASNIGSLLSLFAYPFAVEPRLGLHSQASLWMMGFLALGLGIIGCGLLAGKNSVVANEQRTEGEAVSADAPTWKQYARWIVLAAIPSSLMLGVTTYFTTDIATIPLLWIMPLSIYLLTFIIAFAKYPVALHRALAYTVPCFILFLLTVMITRTHFGPVVALSWHLVSFLAIALVFHGELALTRPSASHLTRFYVCLSVGGFVGGIFNGVIAPRIFNTASEYPLALGLVALFLPFAKQTSVRLRTKVLDFVIPAAVVGMAAWMVIGQPFINAPLESIANFFGTDKYAFLTYLTYGGPAVIAACLVVFSRAIRVGIAVLGLTILYWNFNPWEGNILHRDRSFFGVLKVSEDADGFLRTLTNGTTLHGRQARYAALRREPLTYYHRLGPVGDVMRSHNRAGETRDLAFIGLGAGTLATYGNPGQKVTFYEIDDDVVNVAKNYFTFLSDADATTNIVMGDARLKLHEAPEHGYRLILVDAFSSDAIPVHLLTREALQLYFAKLASGGLVAIHTSNRYLDLDPVLGRLAKDMGLIARIKRDGGNSEVSKFASTWVVIAREQSDLGDLNQDNTWVKLEGSSWHPLWTDDFTSVTDILR